eukprot:5893990-Pyramimonas_sp.AAC.1
MRLPRPVATGADKMHFEPLADLPRARQIRARLDPPQGAFTGPTLGVLPRLPQGVWHRTRGAG